MAFYIVFYCKTFNLCYYTACNRLEITLYQIISIRNTHYVYNSHAKSYIITITVIIIISNIIIIIIIL